MFSLAHAQAHSKGIKCSRRRRRRCSLIYVALPTNITTIYVNLNRDCAMHDFNVTRARAPRRRRAFDAFYSSQKRTRRFITTIAITLRAFIGGHFTTTTSYTYKASMFSSSIHTKTNCHKCMRRRQRNNRNPSLIIQPKTTLSKHCAACVKCDALIFQYLYARCSRFIYWLPT